MSNQKKFAPYAAMAIGSVGLIAGTVALVMYRSSLPPYIVGGIIGSAPLLIGCTLTGVLLSMNRSSLERYLDTELIDNLNKQVIPLMVFTGVSFGIGAGLAALGLESPIAITILTIIACKVIASLFSAVAERSSSPPTPPGSRPGPDSSKTKDPSSPPPSMVKQSTRIDDMNGHNPTDYPKKRECEGELSTERKCSTHATRKKPIIVTTDEDKEDHISEEQQLVQSLEDHFTRIANLKIEIESRKQPDSLVDNAEVDGANADHRVPSPSH